MDPRLTTDHTLVKKTPPELAELEALLPRQGQFKTILRAPVSRNPKDYSFLEDDMNTLQHSGMSGLSGDNTLASVASEKSHGTGTMTKDSGYFNSDMSDMIRRLQSDVESLRDRVTSYKHGQNDDSGGRIYETIDQKKRTSTNNNSRDEKGPDVRENVAVRLRKRGFHRMSHVFDSSSNMAKRILWLLLFVGCLGCLGYNIRDRLILYFAYPVTVDIHTQPVDTLDFPIVTICNLNTYRLTQTVALDVYEVVQRSDTDPHQRQYDLDTLDYFKQHGSLPYEKFLLNVTHNKNDFIHSCHWQGRQCGPDDFRQVFTDKGVCYQFLGSGINGQTSSIDGDASLSVVLNVEQYEYLLGPRSAVGVGVYVTDPKTERPDMEHGVNAAVGSFTTLSLSKKKHTDLTYPYGNCQTSAKYSRARCLADCETTYLLRECSCYMQTWNANTDGHRKCSVRDYFSCVVNAKMNFGDGNPSCECDEPCDRISYDVTISTAATSVYAAESFMRSVQNFKKLERTFQVARDTYHKVDDVIFQYDKQALTSVTRGLSRADTNVTKFVQGLTDYERQYVDKLHELLNAVKKVNETSMRHYYDFETEAHIKFEKTSHTVLSTLTEISNVANKINDKTERNKTLEYLDELISNVDTLVSIVVKRGYTQRPVIDEVLKEIQEFTDKILKGAGQQYKEFRNQKPFYNKTITLILGYYTTIKRSLEIIRDKLKAAKKSNNLSNIRLVLTEIKGDIETIKDGTESDLRLKLRTIKEQYLKDRHTVLELRTELTTIGTNFQTTIFTIKNLLNLTQSVARSLQSRINNLNKEINKIRNTYVDEKSGVKPIGKSQLGEMVTSDKVRVLLDDLRTDIKKVKEQADKIKTVGDELAVAIKPIKDRIVEFDLLKPEAMDNLMTWMRAPSVQNDSEVLMSTIQDTTRLIGQFQADLDDYIAGNTIGSEFYQNNFLQLEVSFQELSVTSVTQQISYGIFDLACDVGGVTALFLGASLLTFIELLMFAGEFCGRGRKDSQPSYDRRLGAPDIPRL